MNKIALFLLKNKTQFILRISLLLFTTLLIIVSVYNLHFPLIRSVSKYDGLPDIYKLFFYSLAIGSNVYNAHQSDVYDFILDSMAVECIVVSTIFIVLQIFNLIKKRTSITYPLFLVGFIIHFLCRLSNNESKVFIVLFLAIFALIFLPYFSFLYHYSVKEMSIEQKTRLYYFENRFSLLFFAFSLVIMTSVLLRGFFKALVAALWGDSNIENFNEIDSVLIGYHTFLRIPSLFQVISIVNFVFLIFTVFRNYKFKIQNIAKKSYSLLDKIEIALKALPIVLSFVCIVYVLGFDIFEYRFFQGQNNLLIILPLMMNFNTLGCSSFATYFAMEFLYFMLVINLFFFLSVLVVNGIKKEKNYIFESISYSLMLPYLIFFTRIEYFLSLTGLSSINYAFFSALFNCLVALLLLPFPLFFIYRKYKASDSKTFLKDSIKSTIIVGSIVTISILFNLIIFIIVNKFDNPSELILCFKDNYHLNISERLIAPVFFISIPPLVSLVWALINYHRQSNTNTKINN